MTINRRTMLTGAALAPFVPVVAAAGIVVAQTASEEQRQQAFRVGTSAADRRNPPKRAT